MKSKKNETTLPAVQKENSLQTVSNNVKPAKTKKEKRKQRRNIFWICIGIGCLIIMLLIIISNVLDVGEKLRNISKYLEWGFYALSIILFYFLILNPLRIILFSPTFSIVTVVDEQNKKSYRVYQKVAKNIIRNNDLKEEDLQLLEDGMDKKEDLRLALSKVFDSSIKKAINKIILSNAKTVFISTAISQNGKLDMMTVLSVNLKMIKEIVQRAGFRPSYARLGKLSVNVLGTALIAESLEGLNFTDLFPTSTANYIAEIPLVKPIANSLLNGLSNGLLTLRIGIVTRRYLFSETKPSKSEIRRKSIKESVKMLPLLFKEVLAFFPQKIIRLFRKSREQAEKAEKDFLAEEGGE